MAAHLGIWNVDKLAAEMPAALLAEWVAYFSVEPFGEDRADARAAIGASAIVNTLRKTASPKNKTIDTTEFMPKFEEQESQSVEEMIQRVAVMTMAMGGEVKI